jgi:hypothetical protein
VSQPGKEKPLGKFKTYRGVLSDPSVCGQRDGGSGLRSHCSVVVDTVDPADCFQLEVGDGLPAARGQHFHNILNVDGETHLATLLSPAMSPMTAPIPPHTHPVDNEGPDRPRLPAGNHINIVTVPTARALIIVADRGRVDRAELTR